MDRFWLYFFGFLTVLIILLGAFRPDQLDNALNWLGFFGVVFLWTLGGITLATLGVIAFLVVYKVRHRSRRQVDGAYVAGYVGDA